MNLLQLLPRDLRDALGPLAELAECSAEIGPAPLAGDVGRAIELVARAHQVPVDLLAADVLVHPLEATSDADRLKDLVGRAVRLQPRADETSRQALVRTCGRDVDPAGARAGVFAILAARRLAVLRQLNG